jgi:hypothetical protein
MKLQSVECLDRGNEYLGGHAAGVWDANGRSFRGQCDKVFQ